MMTLLSWIAGFLLMSITAAQDLKHFPQNVVLAKINENSVTLTCGAPTAGPVTWKLNDEDVDYFEDHFEKKGKNLIVKEVDTPLLGEYSCWRGKAKLSSVYLLQGTEEGEDIDSLLTCHAKSYDCNFSCSWTNSRYAVVRLGIGPECSKGQRSCQWVSSSGQLGNEGFQFELYHNLSPFAEESSMLEVTAEAINNHFLLRKTKLFYLRDIVVPDSPQIVSSEVVGQQLSVNIKPPSSWSTPYSFFSLQHEIEYVLRDDGRTERSLSSLIPKRISKLRVRCRDPLVLSPWSQWTPWKNVRNSCRCKKNPSCLPGAWNTVRRKWRKEQKMLSEVKAFENEG
ncbi:interleukin-12 subunit beta isoform X3 [Girardinichthys multiradiatus]|uniref:interleukin-12 subunit beta isoform X3 n=1 Tax=Girardinichthys multiradiatus TaxID=208333 RepID=UPI001FAD742E|nr:interleukin-12 subunit beta isoform X3 [Girardinichthys multiradiatus]